MDVSAINLLTTQVKTDPAESAGALAGGQQGQNHKNGSNPFAKLLGGTTKAAMAAGNSETTGNVASGTKGLPALQQLLNQLQALQEQVATLSEVENIAEAVANLAAFQALPEDIQPLVLQGIAQIQPQQTVNAVAWLKNVQFALEEVSKTGLNTSDQPLNEGSFWGDEKPVSLKDTDSSQEMQALVAEMLMVLQFSAVPQSVNREQLASIATGISAIGANDSVDRLANQEILMATSNDLGGEPDMLLSSSSLPSTSLGEVITESTDIAFEPVQSNDAQKMVQVLEKNAAQNASLLENANNQQHNISQNSPSTSAQLQANAEKSSALSLGAQETVANDNVVRVPLEQPVRLSPISAGGSGSGGSTEKTKTIKNVSSIAGASLNMPSGVMAQLVSHESLNAAGGSVKQDESLFDRVAEGEVADQILGRITIKPHRDRNDYTIQLDPVELGKVHIKMSISRQGEVQISMLVDNPAALDVLQRDARALEKGLQDAGFKLDSSQMSFNLRDDSQQQAANPFADANDQRQRRGLATQGGAGRSGDDDGGDEKTLNIIRPPSLLNDGLDIRV